jgi:alpha-L-fucosidase
MGDAISKAIEALESALNYIDESPCDPDITAYQIVAYDRFLKSNAVAALAELKALQSGEPVARVIDDGTPEGATEWVPFCRRGRPLEMGDLLYTTPQPVPDKLTGQQWSAMRAVIQKYAEKFRSAEKYEMASAYMDAAPDAVYKALLSAGKEAV